MVVAVEHPDDIWNVVDKCAIVLIGFMQRLPRCFGLGNIANNSGNSDDFSMLVLDWTICQRNINLEAISAPSLRFKSDQGLSRQDAREEFLIFSLAFRRNDGGEHRFSQNLFSGKTVNGFSPTVPAQHPFVQRNGKYPLL